MVLPNQVVLLPFFHLVVAAIVVASITMHEFNSTEAGLIHQSTIDFTPYHRYDRKKADGALLGLLGELVNWFCGEKIMQLSTASSVQTELKHFYFVVFS
jgi:hypothetical protein